MGPKGEPGLPVGGGPDKKHGEKKRFFRVGTTVVKWESEVFFHYFSSFSFFSFLFFLFSPFFFFFFCLTFFFFRWIDFHKHQNLLELFSPPELSTPSYLSSGKIQGISTHKF